MTVYPMVNRILIFKHMLHCLRICCTICACLKGGILAPMAPAENLMASITFILLVILFWEIGRSIIKKIHCQLAQVFRKSSSTRPFSTEPFSTGLFSTKPSSTRLYSQHHEQQVLQARAKFLQDIKQETSTMMGQGHIASMLIKDRILKEAREEAQKILREAKGEIEQIRMEAVQTVQKDMVEMVFSLNQYWQKNSTAHSTDYSPSSSKVSQSAIEKYLDSYHAMKGKTHHTSRLL
jgi:hypothetical protein